MIDLLTNREKAVLSSVIYHYIATASPVSSRVIAKKYGLDLSSASIRNVMADLEEAGYLMHPHTSAGRVPTSRGYRLYVNNLMHVEKLTSIVKRKIRENVETFDKNIDYLLAKTSQILGMISSQLGVVIGPSLDNAIFDKISLIDVAHDKLLIVLSLRTGIIKSIMVEILSRLKPSELEETCRVLNERLSGLPVQTIRETISERMQDAAYGNPDIIRLFIDSAYTFFQFDEKKIYIEGTKNIVEQPEFNAQEKLINIIELIEKKDIVVHLLSQTADSEGIEIRIGEENNADFCKMFSIVSTKFSIGKHKGALGIIGPMRMWYPKMVPLVNYTAEVINRALN